MSVRYGGSRSVYFAVAGVFAFGCRRVPPTPTQPRAALAVDAARSDARPSIDAGTPRTSLDAGRDTPTALAPEALDAFDLDAGDASDAMDASDAVDAPPFALAFTEAGALPSEPAVVRGEMHATRKLALRCVDQGTGGEGTRGRYRGPPAGAFDEVFVGEPSEGLAMDLPASVSRLFVMATASVPFAIVVVRDGADPGDALCVMNGGNRTAFAQLRDLEPGRYTVYVGSETAARAPYYLEASTRGSNELRRFAEPVPMIPPTEAWAQWELRASDGCDPSRVCVEAVLNVHGAAGKQMGGLAPFASAQCTLVNEPGHVAGIRCGNDARWLQPVAHHPRRWVLERRVDAEGCVGDASCSEQVIVDRLELPAGAVMADDRTGRVKWLAPRPGARRLLDSMGTQVPLMPFEPNTPSTPTMEITAEAGTAHIEVLEEGSGAGEGAREDLDAGE